MNTCPKCHTQVQSDACFCEACGWPLERPYPPDNSAAPEAPPQPGSLKERLAVLSGPLRQLKAKWPKTNTQKNKKNADTSQDTEFQTESCKTAKRSSKIINFLITIMVGIGLIAFWVWLLMRKTGERLARLFF